MKAWLVAFASGALFGVGLLVSGMTDPGKVVGFLDLFGAWDPSLAFVMVGAIGVHALSYRSVRARNAPLFDDRFHVPEARGVDAPLVAGAALFGIGWGLSGYCPGPALVSLGTLSPSPFVFTAAMAGGMVLCAVLRKRFKS